MEGYIRLLPTRQLNITLGWVTGVTTHSVRMQTDLSNRTALPTPWNFDFIYHRSAPAHFFSVSKSCKTIYADKKMLIAYI